MGLESIRTIHPAEGRDLLVVPPPQKILAVDVGSGTQDVLLYEEGKSMENCVQMILPSPTQIVAQRIALATRLKKSIFLTGNTMGGGPCGAAVAAHLQAGLKVFATPQAALTFHDDLEKIRRWGIHITQRKPKQTLTLHLHDIDLSSLHKALTPFEVRLPQNYAIAVQDHGFNPRGSNRRFRFQYWEKFLVSGGNLQDLLHFFPPSYMTRMAAVQKDAPGAAVMDTCAAAIWGILCDPKVAEKREEGLIAVNLGNQHSFGALVQGKRIWGIFEHHTGCMTPGKLQSMLSRFPEKLLTNEEVFEDGGHGCAVDPEFSKKKKGFRFIAVTGPQRALAEGWGYYMAAPFGDMMLTGCFGLVAALMDSLKNQPPEKL